MKKYYCKTCMAEINTDPNAPKPTAKEWVKENSPEFNLLPDFLKDRVLERAELLQCKSCKSRIHTEDSIEFDSKDPIESLKDIRVVRIDKQTESGDFVSAESSVPSMTIKSSTSSLLILAIFFSLIGISMSCVGICGILNLLLLPGEPSDYIVFLFIGGPIAIAGLISFYFALLKGHLKFYPDYIESFYSVKSSSDNPLKFYRNQNAVVDSVYTSIQKNMPIYKITVNGETITRGLHFYDARAIKNYLNLYLNPDGSNATQSNTSLP